MRTIAVSSSGPAMKSQAGSATRTRRVRREMDHRGRGPANYTRSDDRILEDTCDKLTEDWGVDARNVQVTVQNGEVTLDGTVENRRQKRRAEDIVHDLSGVGHVQNNLRITDNSRRRYSAIRTTKRGSRPISTSWHTGLGNLVETIRCLGRESRRGLVYWWRAPIFFVGTFRVMTLAQMPRPRGRSVLQRVMDRFEGRHRSKRRRSMP